MADYHVLELQDDYLWEQELARMGEVFPDIHFMPGYCGIYSDWGEARLFVYRDGDNTVLYPFILRRVMSPQGFESEHYDITSPYGYGGPLTGQATGEVVWDNFYRCFSNYCRKNRIITEFIRFHPVLGNHHMLVKHLDVQKVSDVVCVDLTLSEQEIWSGYERNNRKNIKKAGRAGIEVVIEDTPAHFKEFLSIYHHTLARNEASEFYYFNRDFYSTLHNNLKGHFIYAHAIKDGAIVSTELLLCNDTYLHSFLGGTLEEFYEFRPNNILKHEVIKWAREKGLRYFLLGGGCREDDGIFRYKRSFSPHGILNFYVGKKIHDHTTVAMHEKCLANREPIHSNEYFPSYRRY